jgi:hypothetical protein
MRIPDRFVRWRPPPGAVPHEAAGDEASSDISRVRGAGGTYSSVWNTPGAMQAYADVARLKLQPHADAMQADATDAIAEINGRAQILRSKALDDAVAIKGGASAPLMAASNFSNLYG